MNKKRRHELKMLKFKRRVKLYGFKETDSFVYIYRTTGSPCSCFMCSGDKYRRAREKVKERKQIKEELHENDYGHEVEEGSQPLE